MKVTFVCVLLFLFPFVLFTQNQPSPYIGTNLSRGTDLRILRLAVSCRGEFTQAVPGANDAEKVNEVLRQMKDWLKEINIIYGREYSVRFELIPDNLLRKLIFTNAKTDPWPSISGTGCEKSNEIFDIQAKVIDDIIGVDNYDFSQVILSNWNGGCAGGFKRGFSGNFDISVTRHEMGHQFQQSHTINRTDNTNYEPENAGRSIQGGNTDPYAHAASFHQLALHLLNAEPKAGRNISTGNHVPSVNAGPNRAIPVGTPFTLRGKAEDQDEGDYLTYVWDQLDMGKPKKLPDPNDLEGAIFSRLLAINNPSRTFPNMDSVIANRFSTTIEQLPTRPRDLNFRMSVNDNHQFNYNGVMVNASGVNSDDIKITVVDNGGAFKVISQQNAENYTGGSTQTIRWEVSGTDKAPINTQNVEIRMSTDGGHTFPITLVKSTPNNGMAKVVLPNINTKLGRIKVQAIDNYFFSINTRNFTVNQNASLAGISVISPSSALQVSESGYMAKYTVGLLTNPSGKIKMDIYTGGQSEVSIDGINFYQAMSVFFKNASPITITVRGIYDTDVEGMQNDIIQHWISDSEDSENYPKGIPGEPLLVHISDAQIPPIVGVDFDNENLNESPDNWVKVSDIRNKVINNIPLDDGTPTNISLTTNATECGVGGCGFSAKLYSQLPRHTQSLTGLSGITVARGTATFTWSGLQPNTSYRLFLFSIGVFRALNQTVSITGSGAPIKFNQNADRGALYINDKESKGDLLVNYAKQVTSTSEGTITITVTPNSGESEMSFSGIGICK